MTTLFLISRGFSSTRVVLGGGWDLSLVRVDEEIEDEDPDGGEAGDLQDRRSEGRGGAGINTADVLGVPRGDTSFAMVTTGS